MWERLRGAVRRADFRRRLQLVTALAVSVAIVTASVVIFAIIRSELRSTIDESLRDATLVAGTRTIVRDRLGAFEGSLGELPGVVNISIAGPTGGARPYLQYIDDRGRAVDSSGDLGKAEPSEDAIAVAAGRSDPIFEDVDLDGVHSRAHTVPVTDGIALQVIRSLDEVDATLQRLAVVLGVVAIAGIGIAFVSARALAVAVLRPIRQMTETAEEVASTRDMSLRVSAPGEDEVARLASSFNVMLEALDDSLETQRRLVADASHELRTPITSLRTNIEVLDRADDLDEDERRALVAESVAQLEELSELVADIVELARGNVPAEEMTDVRLDEIVETVLERSRRLNPGADLRLDVEPVTVHASAGRLERAVSNLIDNAVKWNPPDRPIDVTVSTEGVFIRDRGPGLPEADIERVFERFYRSAEARSLPGSGLGLAIVRQVADSHGGSVSASNATDGGAVFHLSIPPLPATSS